MSDLPNLDAARWHAQNPKCHRGVGMLSCSRANDGSVCGPCFQAGHLRDALAAVDALAARLAEAEAAGRRKGLEEAQRIAADLSGAYREKHGGGGDYCAALSALTMALAAKVIP